MQNIDVNFPPPGQKNKFDSPQFQAFSVESGARFLSNPIRSVVLPLNL